MIIHPESSEITISSKSVKNNVEFIAGKLQKHTRLCAVVKGNAYGHGLKEFVRILLENGVDYFAVYCVEEAIQLKSSLPATASLVIMGDTGENSLIWCVENDIEFFVFDFKRLEEAIHLSRKVGKKAIIHLELETGMNRTGFSEEHLETLSFQLLSNHNQLNMKGICTHFAGAEMLQNNERIQQQSIRFIRMRQRLADLGIQAELSHACCSAAMIRYPEMHFDMVRCGILLYGFWPSAEMAMEHSLKYPENQNPLKRVIRWKSRIMSIKKVPEGQWIGYGEMFQTKGDFKIAVVPVGYSHGYARSLSNLGIVLIHGHRLSVLGTVNMNCITVDVSPLHDVKIGDEVILIGNQGNQEISVSSFAEKSEQINYEMLTRISQKIPRKIIE